MDYITACTNCGESNYHIESNISFISGVPGFHVCHNCGYYARQFPKLAKIEIELIKAKFEKHHKKFFSEEESNSKLFYALFILIIIIFSLVYLLRIY